MTQDPKKPDISKPDLFPEELPDARETPFSGPFGGQWGWEQPSFSDALSPILHELAGREADARLDLFKAWKEAHDAAADGRFITDEDFTIAEKRYSYVSERIKPIVEQEIKRSVEEKMRAGQIVFPSDFSETVMEKSQKLGDPSLQPSTPTLSQRALKGLKSAVDFIEQGLQQKQNLIAGTTLDYQLSVLRRTSVLLAPHPEITSAIQDNAVLNEAFRRQYLANAPKVEVDLSGIEQSERMRQAGILSNIASFGTPDTPASKDLISRSQFLIQQEVIARALSQYGKAGFLDAHIFDEAPNAVSRMVAMFKEQNVDTVYLEFPDKSFQQLEKLSNSEMRALVEDREFRTADGQTINIPTAKENRRIYNAGISDDTHLAWHNMIATLRESGIRVVNIDKKEHARDLEMETFPSHRVPSTNFTWIGAIKADQEAWAKELNKQGKKPGKYVVFAGAGHSILGGGISKALHMPTFAFTKGNPLTDPAFKQGTSPNGATFYFPGGNDYIDTEKWVMAYDMQQFADILKGVPGLQLLAEPLEKTSVKYREEALDSLHIKPERLEGRPKSTLPYNFDSGKYPPQIQRDPAADKPESAPVKPLNIPLKPGSNER